MTDEIPDGPGIATLVVPMPGSVRPPTDIAAATLSWLSAHGAPRTAEVLAGCSAKRGRSSYPTQTPQPQTELWATAPLLRCREGGRRALTAGASET